MNPFSRTELVIGHEAMERLSRARVAVFGLGGVGGSCAEALARCGIGALDLIDNDAVSLTNINRQAFATHRTVGMKKTDAAEERLHDISPETLIRKYPMFYLPKNRDEFPFAGFDYIVDAIDTVTAKIDIAEQAKKYHIPLISAMGCGNRVDPSFLRIMNLSETRNDPLARIMRRELKKRGITELKVCCSTQLPLKPLHNENSEKNAQGRYVPGSTAFVPPAAGILIASEVMRDLTDFDPDRRTAV